MGIERPVLMPLDGRAKAGALHVQLGGVEPNIRPPEVLQHGDDPRVPGQRRKPDMQVRRLDAADARVVRGVAILQVIDSLCAVSPLAARTKPSVTSLRRPHLIGGQNVRHDDGTDLVVFFDLGPGQHMDLHTFGQDTPPAAGGRD